MNTLNKRTSIRHEETKPLQDKTILSANLAEGTRDLLKAGGTIDVYGDDGKLIAQRGFAEEYPKAVEAGESFTPTVFKDLSAEAIPVKEIVKLDIDALYNVWARGEVVSSSPISSQAAQDLADSYEKMGASDVEIELVEEV